MSKKIAIFSVLVLCGAGAGYAYYKTRLPMAAQICETQLLSQLKAPSSYVRVNYSISEIPISAGEFIDLYRKTWFGAKGKSYAELQKDSPFQFMYSHREKAKKVIVIINYDAQNGFGANLRGKYLCGFFDIGGSGIRELDKPYLAADAGD